jgi:hypothetical protein
MVHFNKAPDQVLGTQHEARVELERELACGGFLPGLFDPHHLIMRLMARAAELKAVGKKQSTPMNFA